LPSLSDIVADTVGALIGASVAAVTGGSLRKSHNHDME
jgi:VanZ family protein